MSKIKLAVNKLISRYKTNDPFEIAKKQNIIVLFEDLKEVYGFYNYSKRYKFIHINSTIELYLQKYCCAHELGHANLHHDINTPFFKSHTLFSTDKIEVEANTFAVELLMPDSFLCEFKNEGMTIYEAAQIYGIPREFAELKKY